MRLNSRDMATLDHDGLVNNKVVGLIYQYAPVQKGRHWLMGV